MIIHLALFYFSKNNGDSKIHVKINNCNTDENQLKRLKYYIHPDKHQGKTNDLFILLDNLDKK